MSERLMSWQYVAGFFDGEGSAGIRKNCPLKSKSTGKHFGAGGSGILGAEISQSTTEVLHVIHAFLSSEGIYSSFNTPSSPGRSSQFQKQGYRIRIGYDHALTFLRKVYPYLIVKRVLAQDLIRYRKVFPTFSAKQRGLLCGDGVKAKYLKIRMERENERRAVQ